MHVWLIKTLCSSLVEHLKITSNCLRGTCFVFPMYLWKPCLKLSLFFNYLFVSESNFVLFFAFAMTADCNSYLAWNVKEFNFLSHASLIFFEWLILPTPPFVFVLSLPRLHPSQFKSRVRWHLYFLCVYVDSNFMSRALLIRLYNSWFNEKTMKFVFLALKGIQESYFLLFELRHNKPCGKLALRQNCSEIISDKTNSVAVFLRSRHIYIYLYLIVLLKIVKRIWSCLP